MSSNGLKVFTAALVDPGIAIDDDGVMAMFGASPLITDEKSLFDAAHSVSSGLRLSEKRTAIEMTIVRERLEALNGYWRWVNSAQQLADGLTKPAARDVFIEQLRRGVHQLKFDPNYTAAKKVSHEAKQKKIEEHEKAAKQLFGAEALLGEGFKPPGQCQLPGCEKEIATKKHEILFTKVPASKLETLSQQAKTCRKTPWLFILMSSLVDVTGGLDAFS